jgi:hypothetical protein
MKPDVRFCVETPVGAPADRRPLSRGIANRRFVMAIIRLIYVRSSRVRRRRPSVSGNRIARL